MPRKDITFEFEADPGDYGLLDDTEFYCAIPGTLTERERPVFVYLDRQAHPPWIVVENASKTLTVTPPFRVGDHRVYLEVSLTDGIWTSL